MPDPGNPSRKDNSRLEIYLVTIHSSLPMIRSTQLTKTNSVTAGRTSAGNSDPVAISETFVAFIPEGYCLRRIKLSVPRASSTPSENAAQLQDNPGHSARSCEN